MQLFCPNCAGTFASTTVCPSCGCRLISPSEAFALSAERIPPPPDPVRPNVLSRLVVGSIVAVGLYFGLREWAFVGVEWAGRLTGGFWQTLTGTAVSFSLRGVAVVLGGAVAGAGRPSGLGTGGVVGFLGGVVFLMLDSAAGMPVRPLDIGLTIGLVAVAAVAGAVGSSAWPGPADIPASIRNSSLGSSLLRLSPGEGQIDRPRPTHLVRLLVTALLATVGVYMAESIRLGMRSAFGQTFNLGNAGTMAYVDLEIAVLIIVLTAMASGATTGTGLRHGAMYGLLLAGGVLACCVKVGQPLPAVEGWLKLLDFSVNVTDPKSALAVAGGLFGLGISGGIVGNSLMPPLARGEQRSRRFK